MNSRDPFEDRLAQTAFRPAPSSLRDQILEAARQGRSEPVRRPGRRWGWSITESLWPHPLAWGTLGLAWLAVVLLSLPALERSESFPGQRVTSTASPAWTAALRDQRALLHGLLEDPPAPAVSLEPGPGAFWGAEPRWTRRLV